MDHVPAVSRPSSPHPEAAPGVPRVVALLAVADGRRFLAGCLQHLFAQGVEAYVIDLGSRDGSRELAARCLGRGVVGLESFPGRGPAWERDLMVRKEELAATLAADWFLDLEVDELPQASEPGRRLAEALGAVGREGHDAVEFREFVFLPTAEDPDHDHAGYRDTMRWYYPYVPRPQNPLRAWRRPAAGRVESAGSAGHRPRGPGTRVAPTRFPLRRYPFLSRGHLLERQARLADAPGAGTPGSRAWWSRLDPRQVELPAAHSLRVDRGDGRLDPSRPRRHHPLEDPYGHRGREPLEILLIADPPGWAIERKTDNLIRVLGDRFRLVKRYSAQVTEADLDRADLIQIFFWMQRDRLGHVAAALERHRGKLLQGVCSHIDLEDRRRAPGLEALRKARAVFANNRLLFEEVRGLVEQPVFYTPNGVDTGFFRPGSPRPRGPELVVGWAGSLTNQGPEHRGFPNVIEPAVRATPGVRLSPAIREERWRTMEEMLDWYHSIDVLVCASRSEGTPNPCLEAAACGIPVVTTRVGNMPEFVVDGVNGWFFERDPADLSRKLLALAADPARVRAMGEAARTTACEWDWSLNADAYEAMYVEMRDRIRGG